MDARVTWVVCGLLAAAASCSCTIEAFRPTRVSRAIVAGAARRNQLLPTWPNTSGSGNTNWAQSVHPKPSISLFNNDADSNAEFTNGIESMDTDLAREIEEALALAQEALGGDALVEVSRNSEEVEDFDRIADMLMETPPTMTFPTPPEEDPPASIMSLTLEEDVGGQDISPPLPPDSDSPPVSDVPDLGGLLQKKAEEEFERLKSIIFGLKENMGALTKELADTEAKAEDAEGVAFLLKKEIEESLQNRKALVERIESEAASEKESLLGQMETASRDLKAVLDQSVQNITEAKYKASRPEKELNSRLESYKAAIDRAISETVNINMEKENTERSKRSMMGKVIQEGKDKLCRFQKSFQFDQSYAKRVNTDLARMACEVETKVRGAYDQIMQLQAERVSLQQQIEDVERNSLEEIAALEHQMELDNERFSASLQKERNRLDSVIEIAYSAYAVRICKRIVKRESVESEYKEKLRKVSAQIIAARETQKDKVNAYLDKLEVQHKKERIEIYQQKVEAVSAIRKQMNAELEVEYKKMEETEKNMKAKIGALQKQTAELKAEFETKMAIKRQLAKDQEKELFVRIEDVRVDMTDKIKTQRRLYENKKAAYLESMNAKFSQSEVELRKKWKELAVVKQSFDEASSRRDGMIHSLAEQQTMIDSYESERKSLRKSLFLTVRVARKKIGANTRHIFRKNEKSPH